MEDPSLELGKPIGSIREGSGHFVARSMQGRRDKKGQSEPQRRTKGPNCNGSYSADQGSGDVSVPDAPGPRPPRSSAIARIAVSASAVEEGIAALGAEGRLAVHVRRCPSTPRRRPAASPTALTTKIDRFSPVATGCPCRSRQSPSEPSPTASQNGAWEMIGAPAASSVGVG